MSDIECGYFCACPLCRNGTPTKLAFVVGQLTNNILECCTEYPYGTLELEYFAGGIEACNWATSHPQVSCAYWGGSDIAIQAPLVNLAIYGLTGIDQHAGMTNGGVYSFGYFKHQPSSSIECFDSHVLPYGDCDMCEACEPPAGSAVVYGMHGESDRECYKITTCAETIPCAQESANCPPMPYIGAPTTCCQESDSECGCESGESDECSSCEVEVSPHLIEIFGCCPSFTWQCPEYRSASSGGSDSSGGGNCNSGDCNSTPTRGTFSDNALSDLAGLFQYVRDITRPVIPSLQTGPAGMSPAWGFTTYRIAPPDAGSLQPPLSLMYNSVHANQDSAYGFGWSNALELRIEGDPSESVVSLTNGSGLRLNYGATTAGAYLPPPKIPLALSGDSGTSTFVATQPDGTALQFDNSSPHRLSSITSSGGAKWTVMYDGTPERMRSILDPSNRRTTLSYDGNGKIASIVLPDGRETLFTVTAGKLASTTTPEGCITQFNYLTQDVGGEDFIHLNSIVDPAQHATTYSYDSSGWCNQIAHADGSVVSISYLDWNNAVVEMVGSLSESTSTWIKYNSARNVASCQTIGGLPTTFIWDNGIVAGVQDPRGYLTTFTYKQLLSSARVLDSVTNPDGGVYTIQYDASDRVESLIDARGNRSTITWDGFKRTELRDAIGNRWTYVYDGLSRVCGKINPLGERITFHYDTLGNRDFTQNALGEVSTSTYENGQRKSIQNAAGYITTFIRDDMNRVVRKIDARSYATTFTYGINCRISRIENALGVRTSFQYDEMNRLRATVNGLGERTTFGYDGLGNSNSMQNPLGSVTTQLYDANRRVVGVVNALGCVSTLSYDASGNLRSIENPLGYRTTTQYDSMNRPRAQMDARGNVTTFQYDLRGSRTSLENALGQRTTTSYTPLNRVEALEEPSGAITTFNYDAAARQKAIWNSRSYATTFNYDGVGRLKSDINSLGYRATYSYDAAGRRVAVQNSRGFSTTTQRDSVGNVVATVDPLGYCTTTTYDPLNRRISVLNGQGHVSTMSYDAAGRVTGTQNPLGFRTTFAYDAAGRRLAIWDAENNRTTTVYDAAGRTQAIVNALGCRTTMQYDLAGRRETLQDANGYRTTFEYDAGGNVSVEVDPLGRRTSFSYSATVQLKSKQDPRNVRITYVYDSVGRQTEQVFSSGLRYTFTYDSMGNRLTMIDGSGASAYEYDALNRLSVAVTPSGQRITYGYDPAGNRASMVEPTGGRFTYAYDAVEQLTAIDNPFAERTTITYDEVGRQKSTLFANGMQTSNTHDGAGRLTQIDYWRDTSSNANWVNWELPDWVAMDLSDWLEFELEGSGILDQVVYQHDNVGNRTAVAEHNGSVTTFIYDTTYRLTHEHRTGIAAYQITHSYDSVGNRKVEVADGLRTTFNYDPSNQLTTSTDPSGATTSYSYDNAGNLTQEASAAGTTVNTWNDDCHLVKVTQPGNVVTTMGYNAYGLRVTRESEGGITKSLWDLQNVLTESNEDDAILATYTLAPRSYGKLLSLNRGGTSSHFALSDALGSVIGLTSSTGSISDSYRYKAYGTPIYASGTTVNPFRWGGRSGYHFDSGLDEYYVRSRYYSQATVRWVSHDLAGVFAGLNKYLYCWNVPTRFLDPSGRFGVDDACEFANQKGQGRDAVDCACWLAGLLDIVPYPPVGANPVIELADCLCNGLTSFRVYCGCGSVQDSSFLASAALTGIDCLSLPVGTAAGCAVGCLVGGLVGMPLVLIGGPVFGCSIGSAIGCYFGDFLFDVGALIGQLELSDSELGDGFDACQRAVG
ncbi:hypothetical protein PLANPX_4046 [Lacipirellula parvula]|uniref:Teneurin-like YD-shell domain-containing protein n=2 Tax=Lacipirellula parvula TaxID=2650471 RepID=A0A5K7XC80_9BACT|nr:hypothetical protein PLANPX_4046 [Lacipirellula parvula]